MKILQGKRILIVVLFQLLCINHSRAFTFPPITYLGIEQGLSNNSVRCIYQDHKGFMWFGTVDGLNRYDGYGFKVFRNSINDSNSLVHNLVYKLTEDHRNNLWIGTRQGASIFDPLTGRFSTANYRPFKQQGIVKIRDVIKDLRTDAQNNVLIAAETLGLLFCEQANTVAKQIPLNNGTTDIMVYGAQAIEVSADKKVWVFVQNQGLCVLDYTAMKLKLVSKTVLLASTLESDGNTIYIGTGEGVYAFNTTTGLTEKLLDQTQGGMTSENIAALTADKNHHLWIGTNGGAVNIWDPATKKMDYLPAGDNKYSLTGQSVFAIYEDKESRKWIGTLRGGINIIDPQQGRFQTVAHEKGNANSLTGNAISSFCEAADGNLWIATDDAGLNVWDRKNNSFINYRNNPHDAGSLWDNTISAVTEDAQHNIWAVAFSKGINRYNKATNNFKRYQCINAATGIENKPVYWIYTDKDNNLWVTTLRQGNRYGALYKFNYSADRFDVFDTVLTDLFTLNEDRAGTLWGGNLNQLVKIDKVNKHHLFFTVGHAVRAVHEDNAGHLWVGTEGGGLLLFDRKTNSVAARYTTQNGLSNNSILSMLDDGQGNLWMSTYNGLCKFDIAHRTCKNYYQNDGLQSNQFNYNAALLLRSGEMAFGGIKGFSLFKAADIREAKTMPDVFLTDIRINNIPIEQDYSLISKKSNDAILELEIPYSKAVLSFDFTALEYAAPNKIKYAWYLDGWDRNWNYTSNIRTANYTHISEGSYVLRIKCTNAEGVWNTKEATIRVIILPPWYRSWWAWILYICATVAAVYFYWQYKKRQTLLEYEIKLANLNAEKEREMNEKKLSFFTNISHEFRAPLTLIINPVKDILHKNKEHKTHDDHELNIVYRNARRLLSLVDQLLLFRKADSGADTLKPARLNFYALCKEVFLCFTQQARLKNITYEFDCANEAMELYADREKMEIILFNLISNALKYTPDHGRVALVIRETAGHVEVVVHDNGSGIPEATGQKLFEKFYQANTNGINTKTGFGIGLYLVKQFTDLHKGAIRYESETGKGTVFTVTFQKGKAHLAEYTIAEEINETPALLQELAPEETEMPVTENLAAAAQNSQVTIDAIVTRKHSVLVIDDDEQIRKYVTQVFKDKYNLYEAQNGTQGLKLAQKYLPDIIISDIKMPGMNGIELCRVIKDDNALNHIPVILLTGSNASETRLQGVEGGADDFITKPFEKEILIARVTNLLKTRDNLQKYFYNEITLNPNNLRISADYKEFLEKCISIVEAHLEDDDFSVKTLLHEIGMSHSTLFRKVKLISGQSISVFIRFIRLRKAAALFINTNYNVNETAFQVGMKDIKHFREQFNKLFDMNPSDYIKKYRKPFAGQYTVNKESFNSDRQEE